MSRQNHLIPDLLDVEFSNPAGLEIWRANRPSSVAEQPDGTVCLVVPFSHHPIVGAGLQRESTGTEHYNVILEAIGDEILRMTVRFEEKDEIFHSFKEVMLEMDPSLTRQRLSVETEDDRWIIKDSSDRTRFTVLRTEPECLDYGTDQTIIDYSNDSFQACVSPDGELKLPFMAHDIFYPIVFNSLPLAFVRKSKGKVLRCCFGVEAKHNEAFAGTGERFSRMNLAGSTIELQVVDALGTNSPRAYKSIPFYLSSRGYGLLALTSARSRLSFSDISTVSVQGKIEDSELDLFFVGGGQPERILHNYRKLTGFPRSVPDWSFGTWMSRMAYRNRVELETVRDRMRDEALPCDVFHLDAWQSWRILEFNATRFPDPENMVKEMNEKGYELSLWTSPFVTPDVEGFSELVNEDSLSEGSVDSALSAFGNMDEAADPNRTGCWDFTSSEGSEEYKRRWEKVARLGIKCIKTDFGEDVTADAPFKGFAGHLVHNLYPLLYQKQSYDALEEVHGEGNVLIWARAAWAGCHRYPLHWGGDTPATWYGLTGSMRGGLHAGLSGFNCWSHDVPGFYSIPNFVRNLPSDDLYVRWTQFGVFTSHLRYHGTTPREPYEYPAVVDLIRKWLNLRYCLIPYIKQTVSRSAKSGYPVMRALLLHHPEDPICWNIDDQYYFGESFLVAPIVNKEGVRDVYLPAGRFIDFWSGEVLEGNRYLKHVKMPLEKIPIYVREGARIPVYPEIVQSTKEMKQEKVTELFFDISYTGLSNSLLGSLIKL